MELMERFNFNDPVEVTEIFRMQELKLQDETELESTPIPILREYGVKTMFGWEDVRGISEFGFIDNWVQYKGPKYQINLAGRPEPMLVFGSYHSMGNHWREFRTRFPLFVDQED